jgi:hypothetical protein
MSMLAHFVQVDADLLDRIGEQPSLAERLFQPDLPAAAFDPERMRAVLARGPQLLDDTIEINPALRSAVEERGRTYGALTGGEGGDLFALMQEHLGRRGGGPVEGAHRPLSLDKAWHGVHYVLCGEVEPGESLASAAALGGAEIGEDFSGYGPARCFTAAETAGIAGALAGPEVEREATERFDPQRMTALQIYPFGWDENAREWVMGAFRELRSFYADAAGEGLAVVTCLV